ncbi:MAG: cell division protein FtsA [Alphaproteobacteria bacterium]|nr:cell division protein FtsA [Alphaproteobacteria bacterium]MBV8547895.1 cell division protein FtsA [Alphaproteobacteria bacterium]
MRRLTEWLFQKPRITQGDVVAALDVGSSKIACFIARADHDSTPRVVGIGHQVSEGIRNGSIVNMEALQHAITGAVATAEQMAGETIERVTVNIAGSQLLSNTVSIELPLNGREATDADIQRILSQAETMAPEDAQGQPLELVHTLPVHYSLDHQKGIHDPIGMTGSVLQSQLHLVSAAFGPVRTLTTAIARCHLEVETMVAAPYASGLACLVEDEMDLGSLVIDMGAGTTSFAVFIEGHLVFTDGIAVGGAHVTNDIARGLTTSLPNAERLKTLFGHAIGSMADERDMIDVPLIGEEEPENANHVPKSHLNRIIQPRIEEILELVKNRMDKSGFNEAAGRRVVLTGGASQLPGVRELAQRMLDKQVRLGRPLRVTRPSSTRGKSQASAFSGLAEATSGPSFATTAGLLAVAMQPSLAAPGNTHEYSAHQNITSRLGQWFKQNM